jgi:hypothetical protein
MGRGALLAALALLAATFAAGPAAAQDKPVLSLVTGRAVSSLYVPGLVDDPSCGVCLNPLTFGSFDNATTLAGPPVDAKFGALFRVHLPVRQAGTDADGGRASGGRGSCRSSPMSEAKPLA